MSVSVPRPHTRAPSRWTDRLVWGVIILCGLMFAGLAVYRIQSGDLNEVNEERVHELSAAATRPMPSSAAPGTAWPQWRGPNRDGISPETGLLAAWPEAGLNVMWSQPTGDGYSSVAVADGCAVTMLQDGKDEAVVCWEAASGTELWRFRYPAHFRHKMYGDGPRSTPAIAGEHVYTVGGTGVVHCLKLRPASPAGEAVWHKDLQQEFGASVIEWGISFSPLVDNGLVYLMPGGPNGNGLIALHQDSGSIAWRNLDDAASYSSPVIAELAGRRQVIVLLAERLVGVAPESGMLLWEFAWPSGPAHTPSSIATPIVIHRTSGDYVFISSGYQKGCALLKIEAEGTGLKASQVYRNLNMRSVFSSAVCLGDYVYGFDDVNLVCLDVRNGQRKWKEYGFGKGALIAADGRLIVLGAEGMLALVAAEPDAFRELSRFQHADERCWTVPAVAGGRLYVRNRKRLVCYDLKKGA
jgi:outer membrane protein assembly factor BamB